MNLIFKIQVSFLLIITISSTLLFSDVASAKKDIFQAAKIGDPATLELLIQKKVNLNVTNNLNETPLMYSIVNNHYAVTKLLLKNGADPNTQKNNGWSPLMLAIYRDNYPITKLLLDNNASPLLTAGLNLSLKTPQTPFSLALKKNNPKIINLILKKNKDRLLLSEAQNNNLTTVKYLLAKGANINALDTEKNNALMLTLKNNTSDLANFLIMQGSNLHQKNNQKETALTISIKNNNYSSVNKILVKLNNNKFWTIALKTALESGNVSIAKKLIEDNNQDILNPYINQKIFVTMKKNIVINNILSQINQEYLQNNSLLIYATLENYFQSTSYLPEENTGKINIILNLAAYLGHQEIVKNILYKNIDYNQQDQFGNTALLYAVLGNQETVVFELLNYGANPNITNNKKLTALKIAQKNKNQKIINLLKKYDAKN